jgi:hypothetical protein
MTTGFQQQQPLAFTIPKTAATQHQVGKKLKLSPQAPTRAPEPRTFRQGR